MKAQSDIYKMDYQEERTAAQNYKQQVQELQQLLQEARNNQQRRSVSSDGEQNLGTTQNQVIVMFCFRYNIIYSKYLIESLLAMFHTVLL